MRRRTLPWAGLFLIAVLVQIPDSRLLVAQQSSPEPPTAAAKQKTVALKK